MFEGIGKYILALFVIYLISYIVKKIELAKIFKKAKVKPVLAYIPFKCTKELIDISHANPKLFSLTLIPFVNINAYINIYKDMLTTFGKDPKEAPLYFFMPMVYFIKLGSGDSKVQIHDYDINNEYLQAQSMLYEPVTGETEKPLYDMTDPGYYVPEEKKEKVVYRVARRDNNVTNESIKIMNTNAPSMPAPEPKVPEITSIPEIKEPVTNTVVEVKVNPQNVVPNQNLQNNAVVQSAQVKQVVNSIPTPMPAPAPAQINPTPIPGTPAQVPVTPVTNGTILDVKPIEGPKSVFTDNSLEPDKRQEKVVKVEQKEEEKVNPIQEATKGRPKMCPKCGAKLAPGAEVCFLCGTHL